jgi:hypothetical protein
MEAVLNKFTLTLTLGLLALGLPGAAKADSLTLTLTNPDQTATPGATLTYQATVFAPGTNTGTVYLSGDAFTFAAPFPLDDSPFVFSFPLSLAAGQSFTGTLFDIPIPLNAPLGTFAGSFQITGGSTANSTTVLTSAAFTATVTPEPSDLTLLGIGLSCVFSVHRARLRRGKCPRQ